MSLKALLGGGRTQSGTEVQTRTFQEMIEDVPAVHIVGIGDSTKKAVVGDTELAPIPTVVSMIS